MIVRTYTAMLSGPAVELDGAGALPLRRLRAWGVALGGERASISLWRARAVPVAVDVIRGGAAHERVPIRGPEAPILGALATLSAAGSLMARSKRR